MSDEEWALQFTHKTTFVYNPTFIDYARSRPPPQAFAIYAWILMCRMTQIKVPTPYLVATYFVKQYWGIIISQLPQPVGPRSSTGNLREDLDDNELIFEAIQDQQLQIVLERETSQAMEAELIEKDPESD
ncbi:hypothetical protein K443DRAFT_15848 [Laccaria amethystina LaAM-08-1]|uniref:Unplaced genomic scaffold K443scaffold_945, whole genome shotgun sequence n=1 Tax=Laccaria amethystina LaAM-08-1 TaxID=1095629 RepID=A0A0C9WPZ3_9AGAR|nr:hypothetical protein K443DRAFT_15848 [Laccaria amethystina LaAM-08-1]